MSPQNLPPEVTDVFLCESLAFTRMQMKRRLPGMVNVIEPDILWNLAPDVIPERAWVSIEQNIYPIDIPEIAFKEGMDLLLIDCPARNLSMMPNGLGYVHNALKKTSINFQTLDLDVIVYHRYHIHRLFDMGGKIVFPSGTEVPTDPWLAENYDFWTLGSEHESFREDNNEVLEFFNPLIDEIVDAIIRAKPKMLGLSIQQCNEAFSRQVVKKIKRYLPGITIIVGGYSCYNPDIGLRAFPECDYMFIGEAELTIGPVVEAIASGEKPFNQPGVLSQFDTSDYQYIPGPVAHNIDQIEFPKYEWFDDLEIYRNYNGYQLTPIIASRGCRWSRCTFCAERFFWRIRSAPNFVDELQWLIDQGCYLFMFNESDLNGMPEKVIEICDEVIRRGLHKKAKLTGQLRIHKKSTRAFFDKLRAANVVALRFGVDAFSENTLRLQKKGYTVEMVSQNLKDCWEAGIYTEVNWVIGVPGETDQDVDEGIKLIIRNQQYIGRLANINPLIMVNGSVYWIDPDRYKIVFREPKEKLYNEFPRAMPADKWYSTEPYIDAQVRKERFEKIVIALYDAGFPIGAWAQRVIEDVKQARDKMRAGGDTATEQLASEETVVHEAGREELRQPTEELLTEQKPACKTFNLEVVSSTDEPVIEVEPPQQIRVTSTHRIVYYLGWFYAIPNLLGEVDLTSYDMSRSEGIVRATSESDLMGMLEDSTNWANSRGHYGFQKKQREQGAYYRAGSFCGTLASRPLEFRPVVVEFDDRYYALREKDAVKFRQAIKKGMHIIGVISEGAVPESMWTIENYNIVKFDGAYYALPQGVFINWRSGAVAALPGVLVSRNLKVLMGRLDELLGDGGKSATHGKAKISSAGKGSGPSDGYSKLPVLLAALRVTISSLSRVGYTVFRKCLARSILWK
ncbi:MAG: B12-binding domain-containing radical SAM protein [Candidatus Thiosymbion ectosymbiont of Robbea hypermnestra]|nr:B12-binding domain-containing radical SAM protein [Candidatus Thiosymbion ectosymbiont of Robbea hypermnestra]